MPDDDDLLNAGFIDDDEPKKKPAQHADSGDGGFDPFADVGSIDAGLSAAASPAPQAGGIAAADGIDPVEAGMVGGGGDPGYADEDLVPGSRKDLWNCPHCGAGNKPGRDDCRSCGKRPDDEVESPIKKQLPLIIGGGVLVFILLLWLIFGGTDTSLQPVGSMDEDLRIASSGAVIEFDGFSMLANAEIAGSGRVVRVTQKNVQPQAIEVFIVFGNQATDDEWFERLQPEIDHMAIDLKHAGNLVPRGNPNFARVYLVGDVSSLGNLKRGDYLSFTGHEGPIENEGWTRGLLKGEYVVHVSEVQTR